jgi:anti-sigma regulatory factor (Ser/Thr protein kinase)
MVMYAPAVEGARRPPPSRAADTRRRVNCELTAHVNLPLGDQAPQAARRAVRPLLRSQGLRDENWLSDVELVISELVTNAVRHGGGCLSLQLQTCDGRLTIAAADRSTAVPDHRPHADDGGRGLAIIEALCPRWGVHTHSGGKQVWVQFAPHP